MRSDRSLLATGSWRAQVQRAWPQAALCAWLAVASSACDGGSEQPAVEAEVQAKTLVFAVEGMHCDACSTAITAKLSKIEGVKSVSVDHVSGRAQVQVLGAKPSAAEILEAIDMLGYEAREQAAGDQAAVTQPAS